MKPLFKSIACILSLAALSAAPLHAQTTPTKDIVDTAVAAGSFKTLAAALTAAGLVDALKGEGPFTVFAPTDAAFAKLPKGTVENLLKPENKAKLTEILTYHVVDDEDAAAIRAGFEGKEAPCPVLNVPDGMHNPLIHRLGILSEDEQLNSVLIGKDGRIAVVVSGLGPQAGKAGTTLADVITRDDEKTVCAALERGDIEAAKARIFFLAPPFDPEAVDARGRPLKKPQFSLAHLRARARVYMALGEWDKALADAEEVVQRQLGTDGGMSLRTEELDEAEQLRDRILKQGQTSRESR